MAEGKMGTMEAADELDCCEDEIMGVRRLILLLGVAAGEGQAATVLAGSLDGVAARLEAVRAALLPGGAQ